ncbi:PQQ-binding-like beta-propeller repeat protein [Dactylosporangium sp. CS-033363]|uniref:outer membrane protein assembly factor BamB family protein n=1 Tax=Dactylosporangium sp. CS-033363 TaxID=3239935 RepID=UPI003D8B2DFE
MSVTIDLGEAQPWIPPDEPRPRRRRFGATGRWVAAALVAVLAAAVPPARAATAPPVLFIEEAAQYVTIGGGRVLVVRYTGEGPHRLEAYSTAGARLWSADLGDGEQLVHADAGIVLLARQLGDAFDLATVSALDARTGTPRWERSGVLLAGLAGPLVVLGDTHNDLVAVDPHGVEVWKLDLPAGDVLALEWGAGATYELTSLSVLDRSGELRDHDLATGAVNHTDHLDLTGLDPTWIQVGGDGRQLAIRSGTTADWVFDRASGRPLWQVPANEHGILRDCGPGRWCRADESGLTAYDARTGDAAWRVDELGLILGRGPATMALGALNWTGEAPPIAAVVDAATGAVRARIDGWHPAAARGDRIVVWHRADGEPIATVGLLNPRTGRIAVLGSGAFWGGTPSCSTEDDLVACTMAGDLTVWRVPPGTPG